MTRIATCRCGQLRAVCEGEPVRVSVCHCLACQQRSGSAFAAQARWPDEHVVVTGEARTWVRVADSGARATYSFCPICGSTVIYVIEGWPGVTAVPLGAFADPSFPPPRFSVYEHRKHPWTVVLGKDVEHSSTPSTRRRLARPVANADDQGERQLEAGAIEFQIESPDSADARWCLDRYFAELAQRFEEGFDPDAGASREVEKTPIGEMFLLARLDGKPVGCGMLRPCGDGIGEIKRMWISPEIRGLGLAGRMLGRLEELAREFGWTRVRLDTNRALAEAQAMYRKAGYREIARYNENPYADFWFEKEL